MCQGSRGRPTLLIGILPGDWRPAAADPGNLPEAIESGRGEGEWAAPTAGYEWRCLAGGVPSA